jgi:hypothetical protein
MLARSRGRTNRFDTMIIIILMTLLFPSHSLSFIYIYIQQPLFHYLSLLSCPNAYHAPQQSRLLYLCHLCGFAFGLLAHLLASLCVAGLSTNGSSVRWMYADCGNDGKLWKLNELQYMVLYAIVVVDFVGLYQRALTYPR